jgi:uncharacterized phage protein (TIGR01671 family)
MSERREIKFRAWDTLDKRWLNLWQFLFSATGEIMAVKELGKEQYGLHQVDIVQFTGLKDKNGKEIYEGDILDMGRKHLATIAQVVWADKMVAFVAASPDSFLNLSNTGAMCEGKCEVIGNIYESPGLLGGTPENPELLK